MPDLSIANIVNPPPPAAPTPPAGDAGSGGFSEHLQRASQPADAAANPPVADNNPAPNSTPSSDSTTQTRPSQSDRSSGKSERASRDDSTRPQASTRKTSADDKSKSDATSSTDTKPADADDTEQNPSDNSAADLIAASLLAAQNNSQTKPPLPTTDATASHDAGSQDESKSENGKDAAQTATGSAAATLTLGGTLSQNLSTATVQTSADQDATATASNAQVAQGDASLLEQTAAEMTGAGKVGPNTTGDKTQSRGKMGPTAGDETKKPQTVAAQTVTAQVESTSLEDVNAPPVHTKSKSSTDETDSPAMLAAAQAAVAIQVPVAPVDADLADEEKRSGKKPAEKINTDSNSTSPTDPSAPRSNGSSSGSANTPARLGYTFGAKPADPPSGSNGISEVDRVRFLQRVARAFQSAQDEGGEVRLRLSPPSLGSLKLEVQVQDGTLSAKLTTETESAKSLLLDNLSTLRDRLGEQNIRMVRFEVEVKDPAPSGNLPDTLAGNPNPNSQGQQPNHRRGKKGDDGSAAPNSAARRNTLADARELNVVI